MFTNKKTIALLIGKSKFSKTLIKKSNQSNRKKDPLAFLRKNVITARSEKLSFGMFRTKFKAPLAKTKK
jgi:hypothetical protein